MYLFFSRYELQQTGRFTENDLGVVADIYCKNEDLDNEVKNLRIDVKKYRDAAL